MESLKSSSSNDAREEEDEDEESGKISGEQGEDHEKAATQEKDKKTRKDTAQNGIGSTYNHRIGGEECDKAIATSEEE